MRMKHLVTRHAMWITIGVVVALACMFMLYAVHITMAMNQNLQLISSHPFNVANAAYEIKQTIATHEIRANRMTIDATMSNIDLVMSNLGFANAPLVEKSQFIVEKSLGPVEDSIALQDTVKEILSEEIIFYAQAPSMEEADIKAFVANRLSPLYKRADKQASGIIQYAQDTVREVSTASERMLTQGIVVFGALSVALVALLLALVRSSNKRSREKARVDFLFRSISENTNIVFSIYDALHARCDYVSTNVDRVLGLEPGTLIEHPMALFDHIAPEQDEPFSAYFGGERTLSEKLSRELTYTDPKTGEEKWLRVALSPVKDAESVTHYVMSVDDLTTIKQAQDALVSALIGAQQASSAKSEFLLRMSHEIRTPMNAITGMTTIARMHMDDRQRVEDCLKQVNASANHLLMILNNVLDLSKIEHGNLSLSSHPFTLDDVLTGVKSVIEPQAAARGQSFAIHAPAADPGTLTGDLTRLTQILLNLLSNAVKYTQPGGQIALTASTSRSNHAVNLRFDVTDNGYGMSEAFQARLFEPFAQEKRPEVAQASSSGIGLAITKNLVSLMNGSISFKSREGEGTTMTVELPFAVEEEREESEADANAELVIPSFAGKRILLAEDNELNMLIARELIRETGATLDEAPDGEAAVEAFTMAPDGYYDLVLMDIQMPRMNGYEATRAIRSLGTPYALTVPILAMTADAFVSDIFMAREAGMNGHVAKPIDVANLYRTMKRMLGLTEGGSPATKPA